MNRILATAAIAYVLSAAPCIMQAQKTDPLMTRGASVYNAYCKTCHQANGQGLSPAFPPLAKSDYLAGTRRDQVIKDVVNGKSGKLKVNGKEYNGVMAALPAKYTAEDIAGVLTYVYGSFGNTGKPFTVAEVRKVFPKR